MPLVNPANQDNNKPFNPNVDNAMLTPQPNQAGRILTFISFVLIIPIFIYIGSRNRLVRLQMKINESSSGIDVQLKKRRDTLTKLVDATKGSMKFEKEVLTGVTEMRTKATSGNAQDVANLDRDMSRLSGRIMATFEAYPQVKSTDNVAKIIDAAEVIEQEIAATRRLYNTYVTEFNSRLFTWPGSVIASAMKLQKLPLFAASEEDRKDVEVKF